MKRRAVVVSAFCAAGFVAVCLRLPVVGAGGKGAAPKNKQAMMRGAGNQRETFVALIEFGEGKLTPPVPVVRLIVGAASAPVPLTPPAAFDVFRVNEFAELAPSETIPALVSLILTAPVASLTVKLDEVREPDVLKSMPPVPALRLAVGAVKTPVALMPPAAFDAFMVNEEAELVPRPTLPA